MTLPKFVFSLNRVDYNFKSVQSTTLPLQTHTPLDKAPGQGSGLTPPPARTTLVIPFPGSKPPCPPAGEETREIAPMPRVTRVTYASGAMRDLDQLRDFLAAHDPEAVLAAAKGIVDAISMLERHPLIGRPVEMGVREFVISRGRTGGVALYDFLDAIDTVVILAVRHQREADFD
jgi:plasmid stabilization system protein ParE